MIEVLTNKIQLHKFVKSCWLSSTILESGSIPFGKRRRALRSCVKRKPFIGRRKWDKEVLLAKSGLVVAKPSSLRGQRGLAGR